MEIKQDQEGACGSTQPEDTFIVARSQTFIRKTPSNEEHIIIDNAVSPDPHSATQTARDFVAVKPSGQLQAIKQSLNVRKETKPQSFTDTVVEEDTGTAVVEEGSDYSESQHRQENDVVPGLRQASDLGLRSSERVIPPLSNSCKL